MSGHGPPPGSGGRPKKPALEKIEEGNRGKREITVLDFSRAGITPTNVVMPEVPEFMTEEQAKIGNTHLEELEAKRIYDDAWNWLNDRQCAHLVAPQLLERYAMASARWIQAEHMISKRGIICGDKKTGKLMREAPWVVMANTYLTQADRLWNEIFQLVKENCLTDYSGITPQEDVMEQLLNRRKA